MSESVDPKAPQHNPGAGDHSICLEARGFLDQSYDSVDHLLGSLAANEVVPAEHHDSAIELALVGRPETLAFIGHLLIG